MNKPATIKDIARQLNISTSTVSRAMRNASDVKPETRAAIMQLSEQLKYQPNKLALSLQQNQTHTIGVMVPNLDYVLATMVKGIDEVALEAGYTVMVCPSNESFDREMVNARRLMNSLVDGFIISVSSETKVFGHFQKIQHKGIPMVMFDRTSPHLTLPRVVLDNFSGGYQATEHLIEQGYQRIAILAGPQNFTISNQRLEGYREALKRHKLKQSPELVVHCNFDQEHAFRATLNLLRAKKRPDALFAISDRMAIGAMLAIKKMGLTMPEDIGLVGFNNEPIVSLVTPAISSVEQPAFELGKTAARLFIEQLNKRDNNEVDIEIVLQPKLIVRASSLLKHRKGTENFLIGK